MNKACRICDQREFKHSGYWNVGINWCNRWHEPIADVTVCAKRDAAKRTNSRRTKYE